MKRRRGDAAALLVLLAFAACGGGAAVETRPPGNVSPPGSRPAIEDPRDLVDTANPAASAAALPVAPGNGDSTATAPLPPPRATTIKLGEGELAAGDAACERGDLDGARKHYAAAPKGVAASVGLARVRIMRVDAPLDYASAKGNAEVAAAAALVIASGVLGPHPRPVQILAHLEQTATPLGCALPTTPPGCARAQNSSYGYGLLNVGAATAPHVVPAPTG